MKWIVKKSTAPEVEEFPVESDITYLITQVAQANAGVTKLEARVADLEKEVEKIKAEKEEMDKHFG